MRWPRANVISYPSQRLWDSRKLPMPGLSDLLWTHSQGLNLAHYGRKVLGVMVEGAFCSSMRLLPVMENGDSPLSTKV